MKKQFGFWLLYSLAIIYGSLIPFDFTPSSIGGISEHIAAIPWLNLHAGQRADWIANLLIYIPWGYLGMSALAPRLRAPLAAIFVGSVMAMLVLAIEVAQLYFPTRTVSLNDILAEALGATLGIALWLGAARSLQRIVRLTLSDGDRALRAGLFLYLVAYLLITFFPFDLVLSAGELFTKLQSDRVGLIIATASSDDSARFVIKFGVEILAAVPIGLLFALRSPAIAASLFRALVAGLLLGAFIEGAQIFVFSAISQGVSIPTRAVGVVLGVASVQLFGFVNTAPALNPERIRFWIRRAATIFFVPYLYLLYRLFNLGGNKTAALPVDIAIGRLGELSFIPFYYHYFTNETAALASFIANFAVYACAGGFVWAWSVRPSGRHLSSFAPALAAMVGLSLAMFVETARLFRPELRPDPTGLLIGAFGAVCGLLVIDWLWRLWCGSYLKAGSVTSPGIIPDAAMAVSSPTPKQRRPRQEVGEKRRSGPNRHQHHKRPGSHVTAAEVSKQIGHSPRLPHRLLAIAVAVLAGLLALSLPGVGLWVVVLLASYFFLVLRFPTSWLLVLPCVLVVFNLAPWTGRFFFDESDAFVMMTLAAWLWQGPFVRTYRRFSALNVVFSVLFFAYMASALTMLWPLPPLDDVNAFNNYHSPFNALRVAKSIFWVFLLWPALHTARARGTDVRTQFARGVLIALGGVALVVLWERWAFPGLINFNNDYRVIGSFASMHIGGAFIDAFFAISIPLIALMLRWRRPWLIGMVPLTVIAVYAALMTFSRGTYAALLMMAIFFTAYALLRLGSRVRVGGLLTALLAVALVSGITFTVLRGDFIQDRFATVEDDLNLRVTHWQDAFDQMAPGLYSFLLGMGPGSFPASYLWSNLEGVIPTTYRFEEENGQRYLRAGLAEPMYLDQRIRLDPYQTYRLTVRYRNEDQRVYPSVALCEKSLLYSYRCAWSRLKEHRQQPGWRTTTVFVTPASREKPWDLERTHTLSIALKGRSEFLDIASISLVDENNRELIRNGDFFAGLDYWYFTVDNNWPWHIENLLVAAYFETGLIGLGAFLLLIFIAGIRLVRLSLQGDPFAPIFLASLLGLMAIGTLNSLFEDPRLGLLLWLFLIVVADRELFEANRLEKSPALM